jgi:hypothetical protein
VNNAPVPKWCKTILAIVLLPVCLGAISTLWQVLQHSGDGETVWVAALSGAICWSIIYLLLPKPMWAYVFGHELTHALWTWFFGGKVRKFKATAKGGHVVVSRNNFLITLAPYFFPIYAMLVAFAFFLGNWVWGWQAYVVWFHLLLGAAYAFHVTLTWQALKTSQSDIVSQGYLFSWVTIFLGNISVLLVGIPLVVGQATLPTVFGWWLQATLHVWHSLLSLF